MVMSPVFEPPRPSVTETVSLQEPLMGRVPGAVNVGFCALLEENVPPQSETQAYERVSLSLSEATKVTSVVSLMSMRPLETVTEVTSGHVLKSTLILAFPRA